jgi:hypothetical protein
VPLSTEAKTGIFAVVIVLIFVGCGGAAVVTALWLSSGREREKETHQNDDRGKRVGLGDEEAARRGRELAKGIGKGKPTASNEGTTWTIRDLVQHLTDNGAIKPDRTEYGTPMGMVFVDIKQGDKWVLTLIQVDTAQKAKDLAAGRGKEAYFGWGRFAISGNRPVVEAAKLALGVVD